MYIFVHSWLDFIISFFQVHRENISFISIRLRSNPDFKNIPTDLPFSFAISSLLLVARGVWTSGLGTVGSREQAKPVLVYLTGSLFTTDSQLIAPQVGQVMPFIFSGEKMLFLGGKLNS